MFLIIRVEIYVRDAVFFSESTVILVIYRSCCVVQPNAVRPYDACVLFV